MTDLIENNEGNSNAKDFFLLNEQLGIDKYFLGFKTKGDWTIEDLNTFISVVSDLYERYSNLNYPSSRAIKYTILETEQESDQDTNLYVYRVKMGSEGGFAFSLINGDVIRELKEFIRFFWYEGDITRDEGKIKLLNDKLSLLERYLEFKGKRRVDILIETGHEIDVHSLNRMIDDDLNELRRLEEKGKLEDVTENLNFMPKKEEEIAYLNDEINELKRQIHKLKSELEHATGKYYG